MTDDAILDRIQAIRAKNNIAHVAIQRLALRYAPEEARQLLCEIVANDKAITNLSEELARCKILKWQAIDVRLEDYEL